MKLTLLSISYTAYEGLFYGLPVKRLPSLDYPYTLDYEEVLLTTLSTSYSVHHSHFVWFTKNSGFEEKNSHNRQKNFQEKNLHSKNSDSIIKIVTAKTKILTRPCKFLQ